MELAITRDGELTTSTNPFSALGSAQRRTKSVTQGKGGIDMESGGRMA